MIVITNPFPVKDELKIIHSLFENGLKLLHVRKPDFSEAEMNSFLSAIKTEWREQLILHSHHHLTENFRIKRIHFTEKKRLELSKLQLNTLKQKGYNLSTSTHSIEDFNALETDFYYAFLSPVFASISKENHQSEMNLLEAATRRTNIKTKLIGLGGIEANNINTTLKAGFDDIALLGTIWKSNNPLEKFKLCQQTVLSY